MTIGRGDPWGREVPLSDRATFVVTDADIPPAISRGGQVVLTGGDLHRTLGGRPGIIRERVREMPIDVIVAELDDGTPVEAAAHLVVHRPRTRLGPWSGEVLLVMNAEFLGPYDVAPRGHPNDGYVETLWCGPQMSARQRRLAARRARAAAHLPHPDIVTGRRREETWTFAEPLRVRADGVDVGTTRSLGMRVRPDAGSVCV